MSNKHQKSHTRKYHRWLVSQANAYRFLSEDAPKLPVYHIGAHGCLRTLASSILELRIVPPKTCLVFLSPPGYALLMHNNENKVIHNAAQKASRGDVSLSQYMSVYVPGDFFPDMYLKFEGSRSNRLFGIRNMTKGTEFVLNRSMNLTDVLARLGKGLYVVAACRGARNLNDTSELHMAQRMDMLTRVRMLPTTGKLNSRFVNLITPNAQPKSLANSKFQDEALIHNDIRPFLPHIVKQLRKGKALEDFFNIPLHLFILHKVGMLSSERTGPLLPSARRTLRRKYGFNTPNEEQAQRLYVYHKSRVHGQNRQNEVDTAFSIRASKRAKTQ